MRLDTPVCQICSATGDDRVVFRHKTIPESEHIVRNRVNWFSGRLFPIRRLFFDNAERDQVFHIGGANVGAFPDLSGNLRHTGSAGGNRRDNRIVERRFPHSLFEQIFRLFKQGGIGIQECVFDIVLNTQLVVHLKQILRRTADDTVHIGFFFRRKVPEIAAGLRKVKRQDLHLSRPSAVRRRFVGENLVFHIGHGRAAEDQHQSGGVFMLIDQKLDSGSEAFRWAGDIRVFIDGKDDTFLFRQSEHIL